MLEMDYLQKIYDYFIENNIPVISFNKGESENFLDNKLTEITIEINSEHLKKWQYFVAQANSCGKIVDSYYDGESKLRFVFTGSNEPYLSSILQENAEFIFEKLQKKYYTVSPEREFFSVLVKPTHRCNLDCKYCYDKPFRETITEDMSMETLESLVKLLSEYASRVQLIWHGGEPTMVGVEWFEAAYQQVFSKYPMLNFNFSLMSNGINLNPEWFELFKKYKISAGASYNAYFQDRLRTDKNDRTANLDKIFKYSREIDAPLGVIDVITSLNYKNQIEIYEFYKKNKIGISLNHIFHTEETEKNNLELSAKDYSEEFLKYFKHWLFDEEGILERSAAEALGFVIGLTDAACAHQDCRYNWLGLNPRGEIYPCDRYFSEKYKAGYISEFNSIAEIFKSPSYQTYCNEAQKRFDTKCEECGHWFACKGGCNGSAFESTGSVEGVEEFSCELFRLNFKGVYDILRNVSIFDKKLNPCAKKIMIENAFYSVKEIKSYIKKSGADILLEYNKNDLLKCSEYEVFRGINYIKDGKINNMHVDFVYSDKKGDIKLNKNNREKDFYTFLKGVAFDAAKTAII